jgi:D-3-phosphoglycerate dehydrogenase
MRARLVYFDFWVDPVAPALLREAPGIDLVELRYADPDEANWRALASAHGYQIAPRGELQAPWFADASMRAHAQVLLSAIRRAATGAPSPSMRSA